MLANKGYLSAHVFCGLLKLKAYIYQ